ncbi:choice-of-anchor B family protein [Robiginitalea sp. IMCC44478]|uniref:choice-of-anchor B family protein n=1 Tax=Robiginitalea sp. IMCC44478 TaxID=3459122 RepID=UPI0040425117
MRRIKPLAGSFFAAILTMLLFACSKEDNSFEPDNNFPDPPVDVVGNLTPCENGMAGNYPCDGYDLVSHISLSSLNAQSGNDIWGWTDPADGTEYALVGLDNGTAFISLADPENPSYLGKLPTNTGGPRRIWRDIKIYQNFAYIVSEADDHGMQVFDLTQLRGLSGPPQSFSATNIYTGFGSAHNIVINEETGLAAAVGTSTFSGGPHFIDLSDPANPQAAGGFSANGYTHDAQIVTYSGPDPDYTGREILIGANETRVVIADITDPAQPVTIATIAYPNMGYPHQGWFTEDQQYFILGDESDERSLGFNSRTLVFDFTDLDNPQLFFSYSGPTRAVDHNLYVRGNLLYLSNYTAGLRVIDISGIGGQSIAEEGFFDTYPANDGPSFDGVWSVYPYFNSGNIPVNDINSGFFLIRKASGIP